MLNLYIGWDGSRQHNLALIFKSQPRHQLLLQEAFIEPSTSLFGSPKAPLFFNIDSFALLVAFHLRHTKSISSLRAQLISFHRCTCSAQYRA